MRKEWDWFGFNSSIKSHFVPDGDGAYELVVESTSTYRVCVHNTKIGDAGCYSTSDLLIPHPTLPGYWKYLVVWMTGSHTTRERRQIQTH